jgi:predicted aldo/keto reductase-like oxidoreductase
MVSPLGIGCGNGISSEDALWAFDQGVNYFFYSTDLHHSVYSNAARAIRELCNAGSSRRGRVVLSLVSYVNDPDKLFAVLLDQFMELRIDYVDIFHWGWITDETDCSRLFKASAGLKEDSELVRMAERVLGLRDRVAEASQELQRRGLARFVGASFHSRKKALQYVDDVLDVLMLRYNVAHTGADHDVFPHLSGDKSRDPGIVVFNSLHEGMRLLTVAPEWYPKDQPVPTAGDCYRFALSNPKIDMILSGPRDRDELGLALRELEKGVMDEGEQEFMRKYGATRRSPAPSRSIAQALGLLKTPL